MAFAVSAGAEKQRVFALVDEAGGGQVERQTAIHFWVGGEVEVIQCPVGIPKGGPVYGGVGAITVTDT